MKKIIALLLAVLACVAAASGCSGTGEKSGKKSVVVTVAPVYDWVRNIAEGSGNADVTLLIDNGVDLHSFQPSADDIIKISTCDVFVYVGGESDEWVENALGQAVNKDMIKVNLLESLGNAAKEEELVEGMQGEAEEDSYDEHVWLSLKNAESLCGNITDALCDADPGNKKRYKSNYKAYVKQLAGLDGNYKKSVKNAKHKTAIFADRFPFRYLFDDYGLSYYAAFSGCSAESEAGFETITFLARKADKLKINTILTIETSDGSIAETVRKSTKGNNQQILTLNSMQALSAADIKAGKSYIGIMSDNLDVLKKALS